MKVKDLIEELQKLDQDKKVVVKGKGYRATFGHIGEVREGKSPATRDYICIVGGY